MVENPSFSKTENFIAKHAKTGMILAGGLTFFFTATGVYGILHGSPGSIVEIGAAASTRYLYWYAETLGRGEKPKLSRYSQWLDEAMKRKRQT